MSDILERAMRGATAGLLGLVYTPETAADMARRCLAAGHSGRAAQHVWHAMKPAQREAWTRWAMVPAILRASLPQVAP